MQFECSSRTCGSKKCAHITVVQKEDPEAAEILANQPLPRPVAFRPDIKAISNFTVQLPLSDAVTATVASGCDDPLRFPAGRLVPEMPTDPCKCGLSYVESGFFKLADCRIYLTLGSVTRDLFAIDCPKENAECRRVYDGAAHALWVASPTVAFSLPVMYMCVEQVRVFVTALYCNQLCARCGSNTAPCPATS